MFDEHYEAVVADTPVAREIHHRIRFEVYCLENGFEDPANHPDHQERDPWDENSVHFIVRHRASGQWIGALRLIQPVDGVLPVQRVAELDPVASPSGPDGTVWEVSRTCILGDFRRVNVAVVRDVRPNHADVPNGQIACNLPVAWSGLRKRGIRRMPAPPPDLGLSPMAPKASDQPPGSLAAANGVATDPETSASRTRQQAQGYEILAGMLRAAIEYTRDQNVRHLFFLINPALARMVKRMQFDISRAGPACDHRGIRHPYIANLDAAVFRAVTRSEEMARLFMDGDEPYRLYSEIEPLPIPAARSSSAA